MYQYRTMGASSSKAIVPISDSISKIDRVIALPQKDYGSPLSKSISDSISNIDRDIAHKCVCLPQTDYNPPLSKPIVTCWALFYRLGTHSLKSQSTRLIASDCDYLPQRETFYTMRVGISSKSDDSHPNPLSKQALQLGTTEPYYLQSFQETSDTLQYNFEKDVSLTLMKRRDSILYNLKTPQLNVTREIYPGIIKMFKPIGMVSEELDKIGPFFQMK